MPKGTQILLAHSSPRPGMPPDPYARHIIGVRDNARQRAESMVHYALDHAESVLDAVDAAATFHDLGKLDRQAQIALRRGRGSTLAWDHIDAGVAHLSASEQWMGAWLVRAHHAPGLPEKLEHFNPDHIGRRLRGRRNDKDDEQRHREQIAHTDERLPQYLAEHEATVGHRVHLRRRPIHGLTLRLALSCLVDADHTDSAFFDTGRRSSDAPAPRWAERLDALRRYVQDLPSGATHAERARNRHRAAFFEACLHAPVTDRMTACEGPVGLGKTTAVAAYLIRRARDEDLRRLIIVAPYTNILTQSAARLREALVLPDERPEHIVVEHHHRADFDCDSSRELAVLWHAPVVLTTAVSFFETLAACRPAALRKLHAVPGSAIFLDEAHAALPTKLWPQNWRWLCELTSVWGCRVVFASGSLARFWEDSTIVETPVRLPELLPPSQAEELQGAERQRVRYKRIAGGRVVTVEELIARIGRAPGPRLVILNTVQNAAVIADAMRRGGFRVLHLSTALTPRDRARILRKVELRLRGSKRDWTLVATSCLEAGVDLSFRRAFRERFSVASTLQVGGRVNRHGEYDSKGGGIVYDFALEGAGITRHPAASISAEILRELMIANALNGGDPAGLVTEAMREELLRRGGLSADPLRKAENARDYPRVASCGQVIDAETRLVVVDERLKRRLAAFKPVGFRALLRGSVQLWAYKIDMLALEQLPGRTEIYAWNASYDPDFLGIMAGVLQTEAFLAAHGGIV